MTNEQLLPTYVTVSEYARLRGLARENVYVAIKTGRIQIELVGYHKHKYIDLTKFKDTPFRPSTTRKEILLPKKRRRSPTKQT